MQPLQLLPPPMIIDEETNPHTHQEKQNQVNSGKFKALVRI